MEIEIRRARFNDCNRINEILNATIGTGFSTAYTTPLTITEREKWFAAHENTSYPVFVATVDGQVIGWASLRPWRQGRAALEQVAEISFFITAEYQHQGFGIRLIEHTIHQATGAGFTHLIAWLLDHNPASIAILKKFGFTEWGRIPDAAKFPDVVCDHLLYGKKL